MTPRRSSKSPRSAPGSWARFLATVVALAAVAVGIPAALVAISRLALDSWHPLPGIGSIDEIRTWLQRELSSTEIAPILLRVLLAAAWLLWLGLLLSVLSSIAASRPSLERIHLPRLAAFDGIAGWIAAGLTALSSLSPRVADSVAPAQSAAVVVDVADPTPAAPRPAALRAVTSRPGVGAGRTRRVDRDVLRTHVGRSPPLAGGVVPQ